MSSAMTNDPDFLNSFLVNMTPDQLAILIARATELRQRPARNGAAPASAANARPTVRANSAVRTSVLRGRQAREGKRRPLNSFIAFRSFYSVLFPELTQKARSGILRFLWQNDPFKAKWAILAKAYSIIRDGHDGEVTLDPFLKLNVDFIRILEPNRYLEAMGWELNVDNQQQYTMARVKVVTTVDAEIATNYSVDDVVKHCYDSGLVVEAQRTGNVRPNGNGPVMAFAAQPNLVINQNENVEIAGVNNVVDANIIENPAVEISAMESEHAAPLPDSGDMYPMAIHTQVAGTNGVFPAQNGQILHGFHNLDFEPVPAPETNHSGLVVSGAYSDPVEVEYVEGAFYPILFEELIEGVENTQ